MSCECHGEFLEIGNALYYCCFLDDYLVKISSGIKIMLDILTIYDILIKNKEVLVWLTITMIFSMVIGMVVF